MENLQLELAQVKKENQELKEKLEFESLKHQQWKTQATMFHDMLWKMIDRYIVGKEEQ